MVLLGYFYHFEMKEGAFMRRSAIQAAVAIPLIVALMASRVGAIDTAQWVGGSSGEWNDADAWRNTTTNVTGNATTLLGQDNGSNGMTSVDPAATEARNIVIGGGAMVAYNQPANGDFEVKQGSNFTIKEGAVWVQDASTYTENGWTQMDASHFILDGGTFRRTGEATKPGNVNDGGGLMMFGSYRGHNNFAVLAAPTDINVEIKNGGRLENTGSLWFGADDEHHADLTVSVNINDGSIDLTGGATKPYTNSTLNVTADLAFFYDYITTGDDPRPKNEQYEINFTGPGSITVDQAGIFVYRRDEFNIWSGGAAPVSYEDLWNQGILKANGLSGATPTPANFADFFTVTGAPGSDDYMLTSLLPAMVPPGLDGDYNGDGTVDAADYVMWRKNDGSPEGYNTWRTNFGRTLGSGAALASSAAVPEPASFALLLMGALAMFLRRRKV